MVKKATQTKSKKKGKGGEQLDLIDVHPKEAKPIIEAARRYKKYQKIRLENLAKEIAEKGVIKDLVRKAKLPTLPNGKIKFTYDNVMVEITPRDELVRVVEKKAK